MFYTEDPEYTALKRKVADLFDHIRDHQAQVSGLAREVAAVKLRQDTSFSEVTHAVVDDRLTKLEDRVADLQKKADAPAPLTDKEIDSLKKKLLYGGCLTDHPDHCSAPMPGCACQACDRATAEGVVVPSYHVKEYAKQIVPEDILPVLLQPLVDRYPKTSATGNLTAKDIASLNRPVTYMRGYEDALKTNEQVAQMVDEWRASGKKPQPLTADVLKEMYVEVVKSLPRFNYADATEALATRINAHFGVKEAE